MCVCVLSVFLCVHVCESAHVWVCMYTCEDQRWHCCLSPCDFPLYFLRQRLSLNLRLIHCTGLNWQAKAPWTHQSLPRPVLGLQVQATTPGSSNIGSKFRSLPTEPSLQPLGGLFEQTSVNICWICVPLPSLRPPLYLEFCHLFWPCRSVSGTYNLPNILVS